MSTSQSICLSQVLTDNGRALASYPLVLIRGLPGSGKSTLARELVKTYGYLHYEADMFFVDEEGQYNYNSQDIKQAHAWCRSETLKALEEGARVVVSNTFSRLWEMEPYFELNVPCLVLEVKGQYQNVHGVPESVIQQMKERWEPIESLEGRSPSLKLEG